MKIVAIIQARMSSSRLPGKVMLDIIGRPMIQHVVNQTRRASSLDAVVIATTTDPSDDPVAAFAATIGSPCTRGSLHDVLDRYYQAAKTHQADIVVRITGDCPLIDPNVIDRTVQLVTDRLTLQADFACNRLPPPFGRSFPIGLDVEVCTFAALERAWRESFEIFHREHVMPFLYEGTNFAAKTEPRQDLHSAAFFTDYGLSQRNFRIAQLHHQPDYGTLRWTVDTPQDLEFVREIFSRLPDKTTFTWYDVLQIVRESPELTEINAGIRHKTMTETDHRAPNR